MKCAAVAVPYVLAFWLAISVTGFGKIDEAFDERDERIAALIVVLLLTLLGTAAAVVFEKV